MQPKPLADRARPLEHAFFRPADGRPRKRRASDDAEALAARLGVPSGSLPPAVGAAGLGADDPVAFELLPLVEVAWADGSVTPDERWCVLQHAIRLGLELGSPAHAHVERWLRRRPAGELFEAWHRVAGARTGRPDAAPDPAGLRRAAEAVAAASGGLFALRPVSRAEAAVLGRLPGGRAEAA